MFSQLNTSQRSISPESASRLILGEDLAWEARELLGRLVGGKFVEREGGSRRADGEVHVSVSDNPDDQKARIRLNSFQTATLVVIAVDVGRESVAVSSMLRREGRFGADDRAEFLIPVAPTVEDRSLIENVIGAACLCLGRGSVRVDRCAGKATSVARSSSQSVMTYELFLPSSKPLPYFDNEFNVRGLPSLY